MIRAILAALAAILMSGCATNAMTGRSQLSLVSEQAAIAQAASAYDAMVGDYRKKEKLCTDEALIARVRTIADRLIQQAVRYRPEARSWQWTIEVIDDPEVVNAFCMPGGKMAVYTGLINKLEPTDDELAQVVGHEIAHALAGHGAEKMSTQILANVAVVAVSAAGRNNSQQQALYNAGTLTALAFINLPNSRETETEADRLGIELAARAGYDPAAATTLWKKMIETTGRKSKFDFLSTHPASPKRVESLEQLDPPMRKLYEEAKARPAEPRAWTSQAPNEKAVGEPEPADGPALAFYSPEMEKFQNGTLVLTCASECAPAFMLKGGGLKSKYAAKDWRGLVQDVIKTNYLFDLSYLYLAAAADGFGYGEASRGYAREALRLSETADHACAKAFLLGCGDIDVRAAAKALAESGPTPRPAIGNETGDKP